MNELSEIFVQQEMNVIGNICMERRENLLMCVQWIYYLWMFVENKSEIFVQQEMNVIGNICMERRENLLMCVQWIYYLWMFVENKTLCKF